MALDRDRLLKPVKKLRALMNKLDRDPTPDKVHDVRTSTRRFEAIFEALSLDEYGLGKSMLKNLGRLRKRAGKIRDMDVLTNHASTIHLKGEEDCAVQLLEYLGARRQKHAKRLSGEIQRLRPELRDDLKRTSAMLAKRMRNNGHAQSGSAEASATATAIALAAQLAAPQRLGKDNLHRYRLKVKELGYILQMAAGASSKFIDDLRAVKDGIGEWHDWEELASLSKNAVHHGKRCGLVLELRRIAQRKYEHALPLAKALRKKYLRNPGPLKKGAAVDSTRIPSEPVWEAIAMLSK